MSTSFSINNSKFVRIGQDGLAETSKGLSVQTYDTTTGVEVKNINIIGATGPAVTSYNLVLPVNTGAAGEVLSTDGTGNLSWVANGAGAVFNQNARNDIWVANSTSVLIPPSTNNFFAGTDAGSTVTTGSANVAIGLNANAGAASTNNVAVGPFAIATSNNAIAIGNTCFTSADNSVCIGFSASATAVSTIAIGQGATAPIMNSIAIGTNANVTQGGVAIGNAAITTATEQLALGNVGTPAVEVIGASTHTLRILIDGVMYKLLLSNI